MADLIQNPFPQTRDSSSAEIAKDMALRTQSEALRRPIQLAEAAQATIDARRVLFEALEGIGKFVENFGPIEKMALEQIRSFRMAVVTEMAGATKAFADIRKFFLDDQHAEEIARLREFVDLCERLQTLKKQGFLDAVSDTILKL